MAYRRACDGIDCAFFGCVWISVYQTNAGERLIYPALASAVIIAAVLCFSFIYTPWSLTLTALILLLVIAQICLTLSLKRAEPSESNELHTGSERRLPWRGILHVSTLGAYLGYCAARMLSLNGSFDLLMLTLPILILAALAALLLGRFSRRRLTFALASRIAFPVSIAGALFVWLPDEQLASTIQFCFAVLGCSFFMLYHWVFNIHWTVRYRIIPVSQIAAGALAPSIGMVVGWAVETLLVALGFSSPFSAIIMTIVLLFLYMTVSAVMPFGSEIHIADSERDLETISEDTGIWKSALGHLSNCYGLTSRESDVFALLSRGRNIPHIGETLVISQHTVKTHVYRIYAKLDVGSQQELITLVEECAYQFKELSKVSAVR